MSANGNGKDHHDETQENTSTDDRRADGRLSDADFDAIFSWIFEKTASYIGRKILHGVGWILICWTTLAVLEVASGGKVSLGAAIKFLMDF